MSLLVEELGALPDRHTEGLPRGVALRVVGHDGEAAGRAAEALAVSLLPAGWALEECRLAPLTPQCAQDG